MPSGRLMKQGQERRDAIMVFLRSYVADHGYPPSTREIGQAVGLSSLAGVREALRRLESDGQIRITPGVQRGIAIVQQRKRK